MDIAAAILLFLSSVIGIILITKSSMGMEPGKKIIFLHAGLFVLGFIALGIYALVTEEGNKHVEILIMLSIAIVLGLWLWLGKFSAPTLKVLSICYTLVAGFGMLWLLTFIIT
ncbi:MAG: hypothetical protein ACNS60_21100 [Candidatus Cyclobacteriaceae bacterium M2_1C_046]